MIKAGGIKGWIRTLCSSRNLNDKGDGSYEKVTERTDRKSRKSRMEFTVEEDSMRETVQGIKKQHHE